MENPLFDIMAEQAKLGAVTAPPRRVAGGYMHQMYQLETDTRQYAVKLLNPAVMRRPDVFRNFQRAEYLEQVLYRNMIPVVPAKEINGCKMQCINGQYFYVFPWVEGNALRWEEIDGGHCRTIGALLVKIHKIKIPRISCEREKIDVDWDTYIGQAEAACPEIAEELKSNRELFYYGQEEYNAALHKVPAAVCICDGDMDSKNVLWVDGKPRIIDLECLDYGNPYMEMFQLALSWAGDTLCRIDYGFLQSFLNAYRQEYGAFRAEWSALYGIGFSWLEWLAYNIKRALGLECEMEEERQLGIRQVHETVPRIVYYAAIKKELLDHLASAMPPVE